MTNKVIGILANILMVVEAGALAFLVREWIKAKKEQGENENGYSG